MWDSLWGLVWVHHGASLDSSRAWQAYRYLQWAEVAPDSHWRDWCSLSSRCAPLSAASAWCFQAGLWLCSHDEKSHGHWPMSKKCLSSCNPRFCKGFCSPASRQSLALFSAIWWIPSSPRSSRNRIHPPKSASPISTPFCTRWKLSVTSSECCTCSSIASAVRTASRSNSALSRIYKLTLCCQSPPAKGMAIENGSGWSSEERSVELTGSPFRSPISCSSWSWSGWPGTFRLLRRSLQPGPSHSHCWCSSAHFPCFLSSPGAEYHYES